MNPQSPRPRGLYFEEFNIGLRVYSPSRTITEADIVGFAGLTGDYNSIHIDEVYARESTFGQRVAHGLLGLSIASGLAIRTGILEGTVLAFREISDWKYRLPIFIGDTIRVEIEVEASKPLPRLGGGSLNLAVDVINQNDEIVMRGHWSILVRSKPNT